MFCLSAQLQSIDAVFSVAKPSVPSSLSTSIEALLMPYGLQYIQQCMMQSSAVLSGIGRPLTSIGCCSRSADWLCFLQSPRQFAVRQYGHPSTHRRFLRWRQHFLRTAATFEACPSVHTDHSNSDTPAKQPTSSTSPSVDHGHIIRHCGGWR